MNRKKWFEGCSAVKSLPGEPGNNAREVSPLILKNHSLLVDSFSATPKHCNPQCCDCKFWVGGCLKNKPNRIAWSNACELFKQKIESGEFEVWIPKPIMLRNV